MQGKGTTIIKLLKYVVYRMLTVNNELQNIAHLCPPNDVQKMQELLVEKERLLLSIRDAIL